MAGTTIPKKLHFVWVGDQSRRPDACIDTWRTLNPDFEIAVWGNDEWLGGTWRTASQMNDFGTRDLPGVADLMRYEILFREGGFALDADAVCVEPLPDWLFETDAFASWENELMRPGLIANGYLGAVPGHPFYDTLIQRLAGSGSFAEAQAWLTTGPVAFTDFVHEQRASLTVYPSHYFIPRHYTGWRYTGGGHVFGAQLWGSTELDYASAEDLVATALADLNGDGQVADAELTGEPWADYHGPPGPGLAQRAWNKALRIFARRDEPVERVKVGQRAAAGQVP